MYFLQLDFRTPPGYDRTRSTEIGNKDIEFQHLEEAYTSEHWLVRIYKVKDLENRVVAEPKERKKTSTKKRYVSKKVRTIYLVVSVKRDIFLSKTSKPPSFRNIVEFGLTDVILIQGLVHKFWSAGFSLELVDIIFQEMT